MIDLARYFLPYQIRWIQSQAPLMIGEKSRRVGWTYASAFRAVDRRVRWGTDLFHSSTDLTAAREFIEACQRWARVFNAIAVDVGLQTIDESGLQAFVLRFNNGAKILAGSSNPNFFRGKGGDVDADEFAFHLRARDLYKAMQPAALIWGHQMRVWSTHNGEGAFFNQLVKQAAGGPTLVPNRTFVRAAAADADAPGRVTERVTPSATVMTNQRLKSMRVTLFDAVSAGLVERIKNLPAPSLSARRSFIEEIRASCPDEDAWNEEYLCRPSSEQSALLSYELIAGCECPELQAETEWGGREVGTLGEANSFPQVTTAPLPHSSLYLGFDVGRHHDRSALWVLERAGDVLWTRAVRVLEHASFTTQEEALDEWMRLRRPDRTGYRVARLCIDSTGIGAMLAERLRERWGHRVEPIHFTAGVKSEIAMPLVRLFERKQIRIPADPAIREDLHSIRKGLTIARHVRLDARRTSEGHGDRFWALALANHAADTDAVRLPPPVQRKPLGW